jgi:O-antigen/teichoic acid export membrane protein
MISSSLLFWIIIGKLLDPEQYGIISTSMNFISVLSGIVMLGFPQTLIKLISEDEKNIKKYFLYSLKITLLVNVVVILILLFFSNVVTTTLKFDFYVLLIVLAGIFFQSMSSIFTSIGMGLQRMKKLFTSDVISQFIRIILSIVLIFSIPFFFNPSSKYFGPLIGIVVYFFLIFVLRFDFNALKTGNIKVDKKQLAKYSFPAFLTSISWLIFSSTQYIILTAFKNPEITGKFSVAMLLVTPVPDMIRTVSSSLFPIISKLSKKKDSKKSNNLLSLSFKYSLFIAIPFILLMISFSKAGVLIFSSEKFIEATNFLPILAIGAVFLGVASLFIDCLYASCYPETSTKIAFLLSILFLTFSLILTYLYSALGISYAYLISSIISFLVSFVFVRKYLKFKIPVKPILKIIVSSLIMFAFLYLISPIAHDIYFVFLLLVPSAIIYLFSLYFLNFYSREDLTIIKFISEKSPSFIRNILNTATKFLEKKVKQ